MNVRERKGGGEVRKEYEGRVGEETRGEERMKYLLRKEFFHQR